jgi:hypothetical protein
VSEPVTTDSTTTPASMPASPVKTDIRHQLTRPAALVVLGVLVLAAVGLNATAQYMKLTFRKEPVALRAPVSSLPSKLGAWVQVTVDKPLPPDIEHTLGTRDYVMRTYVNTALLPPAEAERLIAMETADREREAYMIRQRNPRAVLTVSLTYYTGMVDTVAHIPERCFVGGGFDTTGGVFRVLPVTNLEGKEKELTLRMLQFEDRTSAMSSRPLAVGYVFQVNGAYEADAVGGVRKRLQKLTEKHAYYAKIELMLEMRDAGETRVMDAAADVYTDFLDAALPEIERILPDWQKVNEAAE